MTNAIDSTTISDTSTFETTQLEEMEYEEENESTKLEAEEASGVMDNNYNELQKYWYQRYRIFSNFDEGILMDEGIQSISSFQLLIIPRRQS